MKSDRRNDWKGMGDLFLPLSWKDLKHRSLKIFLGHLINYFKLRNVVFCHFESSVDGEKSLALLFSSSRDSSLCSE